MTKADRSRIIRVLAVLVAVLAIVGVATVRSTSAAPARGAVSFTPSENPVRVTAPSGHVIGLTWVDANSPIALAGGKKSPSDTVYLHFRYLTANDASITQTVNGRSVSLSNMNGDDPGTAARLGADSGTVDVWATVNSLDLCITAETFYTIINGYAANFGGQLGEVLALVAQIFTPFAGKPAGSAGPCVPLKELVPLLAVIVQAGVPLPDDLPAENIDINAYAADITAAPGVSSLSLPVGRVEVDSV